MCRQATDNRVGMQGCGWNHSITILRFWTITVHWVNEGLPAEEAVNMNWCTKENINSLPQKISSYWLGSTLNFSLIPFFRSLTTPFSGTSITLVWPDGFRTVTCAVIIFANLLMIIVSSKSRNLTSDSNFITRKLRKIKQRILNKSKFKHFRVIDNRVLRNKELA